MWNLQPYAFKIDWRLLTALSALLLASTVSCVGTIIEMPVTHSARDLALDSRSVGLLRVQMRNRVKPHYVPVVVRILVRRAADGETFVFPRDHTVATMISQEDAYSDALLSVSLSPGDYEIVRINCWAVLEGWYDNCDVHFRAVFSLRPSSIAYLGRIDAVVRERVNDSEIRARGVVIPAVSWAGFRGGTFDVEIHNDYEEGVEVFRDNYAVLVGREIESAPLSPMGPVQILREEDIFP